MHEVLVNRFGGLSLPRKSVVRLTDRPDMTLVVYRGRKTTMQQCNTLDSKTLLGFSDVTVNSAAEWTTWENWGSGGGGVVAVVCVGGGGEAILKLKGAGATHALPRSYLHVSCLPWPVLYTVSLKQTPMVSF